MAVAASEEQPAGTAPGAFQLPPYKQARPTMWYKQAESLMDMRNITNPAFRLVLVQCALSDALQESVAHILEADIPASEAYSLHFRFSYLQNRYMQNIYIKCTYIVGTTYLAVYNANYKQALILIISRG